MSNIVRYTEQTALSRKLERELQRSIERIQYTAEVSQAAIEEVGNIHEYAAFKAAATSAALEMLSRASGPMTQAALQVYQQQFLADAHRITAEAGERIACIARGE
jgi:hypothetical protein